MQCKECADALGGYLDGELTATVLIAFEAHVRSCVGCGRLVASCKKTIEIYRAHNGNCVKAPLPRELHRKLVARVAAMPPLGPGRHPSS